jgi:serine protease Do
MHTLNARSAKFWFPCCVLVLTASSLVLAQTPPSSPEKPTNPAVQKPVQAAGKPVEQISQGPEVLQQLNAALESLAARISPAVVQIQVTGYGALEENEHGETALIARQRAIGSGVIVDSDGYIMTNAHVVKGAQRVRVVLPVPAPDTVGITPIGKQHILDAKIVGVHPETDLALLKVDQKGLPTLALANSRRVHQGQLVFAVGSPEGLENTVTMGVVSSVSRQPDPDKPMIFIQTDAPINPGNSGGPLVDIDGYVLGINTMILSEGGGSEGLGFAIPARVVRFVYQSLRKYGHVHRVEIEAGAQTITPDLAAGLGLAQGYGVVISDVIPGGPAEAAGLKIGDIVLSADDHATETLPALTSAMYLHPLDQVMKLVVLRGKQKMTIEVPVIEQRDPMDKLMDAVDPDTSLIQRLGVLAVDLTDQLRSAVGELRIPSGVVIVARAANLLGPQTGLKTGDVVHSVNGVGIDSVESLRAELNKLKANSPVVLQVEREGGLQWVAFELE